MSLFELVKEERENVDNIVLIRLIFMFFCLWELSIILDLGVVDFRFWNFKEKKFFLVFRDWSWKIKFGLSWGGFYLYL